jgi:hypothetical protein
MWKLRDAAEGATKQDNALLMKSRLEALRSKIRDIKNIEVGLNTSESADSYDVVLCSEFENAAALQRYQSNPEHLKVADFIAKVRAERKVVDYEVP